jgi:DNA-binding MarR family transcriptional regulator
VTSRNRRTPGPESDIGQIEQAVSRIATWANRHDVQQATMRRAKCELPRGHLSLLTSLDDRGTARLSDLAESLGVDNSTLTPQAKRLEREGLIVRAADPSDNRASLLRVSRAGKNLLSRLGATRRAIFSELLADWSSAKQSRAATMLNQLASSLEASTQKSDHRTHGGPSTRRRPLRVAAIGWPSVRT